MKENKQLSLFDIDNEEEKLSSLVNPENEQDQKNYNKAKNHYLKALAGIISNEQEEEFRKEVRRKIYSKVYLFKDCFQIIDFLLKIEFEDHFKKWEFVSLLLELTFEALKNGNEVNSFDDIHKLYFKKILAEFEENEALQNEYRSKIDELFIKYHIEEQEKENFLKLIDKYIEAKETIIYYDELNEEDKQREESFLKRRYEDSIQEISKDILQKEGIFPSISEKVNSSIEEMNQTRQEIIRIIESKGITFFDSIIEEFAILQNKMYFDTYSSYYESNFLDMDYLEALKFVKAGLINDSRFISKEENEEAIRINEYIEKGLSILKNYISLSPEEKEEIQETKFDDLDFIENLEAYGKNLPEDSELKNNLSEYIQTLRNNLIIDKYGTNKSKPVIHKVFSGKLGENFSSQPEFIEKIDQKKNPSNVEFTLIAIQNNKSVVLPAEFKPVINGLLTYYNHYGTQEAFSLIQFYEGYYKTQFHSKEQNSILNIKEIDEKIRQLRFLVSKIVIKRKNEEGETIDEEIINIEEMFFSIIRKEVQLRKYNKKTGTILETSNNIYYQFTSKPVLYRYAELFSNKNILTYNADFWLDLKGKKSKFTSQRNILIRDELIKRVILITQSKGKLKNNIVYKNFFKDFCSIDYEQATKKQKEELRNVLKYFLHIFEENNKIDHYEEYEEKRQKIGVKIYY